MQCLLSFKYSCQHEPQCALGLFVERHAQKFLALEAYRESVFFGGVVYFLYKEHSIGNLVLVATELLTCMHKVGLLVATCTPPIPEA